MPLTNSELKQIEHRIDEIKSIMKICDEFRDADVIINLQIELSEIEGLLDVALDSAKEEENKVASGLLRYRKGG